MRIVPQSVELLAMTPNPLELIELAGRTCYKSEDKIAPGTAEPFIRKLILAGHESVLEHASATFRITCDRGVSHELVRHRIASFSQESTRYCNYGNADEITVIEPPGLTIGQYGDWKYSMSVAESSYMLLLGGGSSPQIARSVLPNSLKTELVMTANFREWRTILKQRCSPKAHPQAREIANMILEVFRSRYPVIVENIG